VRTVKSDKNVCEFAKFVNQLLKTLYNYRQLVTGIRDMNVIKDQRQCTG